MLSDPRQLPEATKVALDYLSIFYLGAFLVLALFVLASAKGAIGFVYAFIGLMMALIGYLLNIPYIGLPALILMIMVMVGLFTYKLFIYGGYNQV